MMNLTERQKRILAGLVEEHVQRAAPVSSQALEENYDFAVSPATIRNEMFELTLQGYLFQPHTSAGRVPTDKGYRFYVDELLRGGGLKVRSFLDVEAVEDDIQFLRFLTGALASSTSTLALAYLTSRHLLWKEGWEAVLGEPEFVEPSYLESFVRFLRDFERTIEDFALEEPMRVYIGKENPFSRVQDFSVMVAEYRLPGAEEKSILAMVGPKRMAYPRNLSILHSLVVR